MAFYRAHHWRVLFTGRSSFGVADGFQSQREELAGQWLKAEGLVSRLLRQRLGGWTGEEEAEEGLSGDVADVGAGIIGE